MLRVRRMSYHRYMASIEGPDLYNFDAGIDSVLDSGIFDRSTRHICGDRPNGSSVYDVRIRGHVDPVRDCKALMKRLVGILLSWIRHLDAESVQTFQTMYYVVFTVAGSLLVFIPDFHVQYVSDTLGPPYYNAWVLVNLICPSLTLIGRRFITIAARKPPGTPNYAYGAAWLQLCGDGGVWGNVLIYVASMIITGWWTKELYVFAFLLMGVAGGGMFTVRSARRIMQIKILDRTLP